MDKVNEDYWYKQWHLDTELHRKLGIEYVTEIKKNEHVSIYADTDSCASDSMIRTSSGCLSIEDWYNKNIKNGSAGETSKGHESVKTNDCILNYSDDGNLYYAPVKRIIRHSVSKPKWKLKTKSGNDIIVTNDHSMIVFRDGNKIEVKPSEILKTYKVLSVLNNVEYILEDIEYCEQIGEFVDEYVYDVEVDDETHTFIANDILVHNSLFVSFLPAIEHSKWKDLVFNKTTLDSISEPFIVLAKEVCNFQNSNCLGIVETIEQFKDLLTKPYKQVLIDGRFILDRELKKLINSGVLVCEPRWNWARELDYIHGIDQFRYGDYFKKCLEDYAGGFGVENKQDFELERVSESIISLAKKKYIQHVAFEDGIPYERLTYLFPKGVELVRSSTPAFAREKIINIVKYLFENSDTFNIKDLLKLVKGLRKEFELADIDDISMQSSCSNYDGKVIDDKSLPLKFVSGAHFAVKASAYHNYIISQNKDIQMKYEPIKSGTKIKYYYCKNRVNGDVFAYIRGQYPMEVAPAIDYDTQFEKSILSPINTIIEPLGMPEITARLSVVMDIFSGFGFGK